MASKRQAGGLSEGTDAERLPRRKIYRPVTMVRNGDLWLIRRQPKVCLGPVEKVSVHTPGRITSRRTR